MNDQPASATAITRSKQRVQIALDAKFPETDLFKRVFEHEGQTIYAMISPKGVVGRRPTLSCGLGISDIDKMSDDELAAKLDEARNMWDAGPPAKAAA